MQIFENKEICAECGGRCCKKCGCDYVPTDFENMSIDYLQKKLEEGNISIVSTLTFKKIENGKLTCTPFLYLRARNLNRPTVDLLSLKTTCSLLQPDGCPYDYKNRPTGAKNVIPEPNLKCHPNINPEELIIKPWERYQKLLSRLVRRLTGLSVDAKLEQDVENLFYDIIDEKFDNVSKMELIEMQQLVPLLAQTYEKQSEKIFNNLSEISSPILIKSLEMSIKNIH